MIFPETNQRDFLCDTLCLFCLIPLPPSPRREGGNAQDNNYIAPPSGLPFIHIFLMSVNVFCHMHLFFQLSYVIILGYYINLFFIIILLL
jgi:hypothetical protein